MLLYPLLVWLTLEHLGALALGGLLAALAVLRWWALGRPRSPYVALAALGLLAFLAALALGNDPRVLKSYPVLVNAALLVLFAASLWRPPTVIERGLRLAGQAPPDHARPYLWWVTLAWCGFFLVNGAIAAWTALAAPTAWWALYNGALSYLFIAVFFGIEWLIRGVVKRRIDPVAVPGD